MSGVTITWAGRAFKVVATISVVAVAILSATVLVQTVLSGLGIS